MDRLPCLNYLQEACVWGGILYFMLYLTSLQSVGTCCKMIKTQTEREKRIWAGKRIRRNRFTDEGKVQIRLAFISWGQSQNELLFIPVPNMSWTCNKLSFGRRVWGLYVFLEQHINKGSSGSCSAVKCCHRLRKAILSSVPRVSLGTVAR